MSEQLQPNKSWTRFASAAGQSYLRGECHAPTAALRILAAGLVLALAGLLSCSDDKASRANSELRVGQPAAASHAGPAAQEEAAVVSEPAASHNQRYRVLAGTAYFYTSPGQAKPTGQYLLRGDVLHGEDGGNGFVRTQFVNPQGATVTGWLKAEELGKLSAATATSTVAPVSPALSDDSKDAVPVSSPSPARTASSSSGSQTAVVRVARSHFYNSPDLAQPRKAYCEQGDKVRLGQEQGEAVYVTFTNWEKVTTKGWMKKETLRFAQ